MAAIVLTMLTLFPCSYAASFVFLTSFSLAGLLIAMLLHYKTTKPGGAALFLKFICIYPSSRLLCRRTTGGTPAVIVSVKFWLCNSNICGF
jgi:hypothetical protein